MSLSEDLAHGLDALRLSVSGEVRQKLLDYLALIEKWNRVYNLTAVREPQKMLPASSARQPGGRAARGREESTSSMLEAAPACPGYRLRLQIHARA